MNWKKLLLPPAAIYAVIFLFISSLIGFKIDQTQTWVWIICLAITIVGLYLASNYAKPATIKEGIIYGITWLAVLIILDLVLTVPFTGWAHFSDWRSYLPYGLTLIFPVVMSGKKR